MTNFGTDWKDNDRDLEPVVEIFQGCRMSSEAARAPYAFNPDRDERFAKAYNPQGMVSGAWAKGYRLGVIASSDHNSTHISYAMVYTGDASRSGILDAIRKRHTYGATDNIILDVRMGGHFMGDEFKLDRAQPLHVYVRGTGPLSRVEIIRDGKVIYSNHPQGQTTDFKFTDYEVTAGFHHYYARVQQADGMIAWSSPMFIHYTGAPRSGGKNVR